MDDLCARQNGIASHGFLSLSPQSNEKESTMNSNQVEGKLQDIGGKIQEEAGK
jgi:hypothetical protein